MTETPDSRYLKEWEIARSVVKGFDELRHDLRKYGFTFIAALLTAESILIPLSLAEAAGKVGVPDGIKLAVMSVTLLLIVAVRLIERNYQLLQAAAAQRALVLERKLNLELTETIMHRYKLGEVWKYEFVLYIAFTLGTLLLGLSILFPSLIFMVFLTLAWGLAVVAIWRIKSFALQYEHGFRDWTLDRLEYRQKEKIQVTVTNLGIHDDDMLSFRPDDVVFEVRSFDQKVTMKHLAPFEVFIGPRDSYTWLFDTAKLPPGLYQVIPFDWKRPLNRFIRITKPNQSA